MPKYLMRQLVRYGIALPRLRQAVIQKQRLRLPLVFGEDNPTRQYRAHTRPQPHEPALLHGDRPHASGHVRLAVHSVPRDQRCHWGIGPVVHVAPSFLAVRSTGPSMLPDDATQTQRDLSPTPRPAWHASGASFAPGHATRLSRQRTAPRHRRCAASARYRRTVRPARPRVRTPPPPANNQRFATTPTPPRPMPRPRAARQRRPGHAESARATTSTASPARSQPARPAPPATPLPECARHARTHPVAVSPVLVTRRPRVAAARRPAPP